MMAGIGGLLKLFDRRFVKLENFSSLEGGGGYCINYLTVRL